MESSRDACSQPAPTHSPSSAGVPPTCAALPIARGGRPPFPSATTEPAAGTRSLAVQHEGARACHRYLSCFRPGPSRADRQSTASHEQSSATTPGLQNFHSSAADRRNPPPAVHDAPTPRRQETCTANHRTFAFHTCLVARHRCALMHTPGPWRARAGRTSTMRIR